MDEIARLQKALKDAGTKQWPAIAESTGVPLRTLQKIAYGSTRAPRANTFLALVKYFASAA